MLAQRRNGWWQMVSWPISIWLKLVYRVSNKTKALKLMSSCFFHQDSIHSSYNFLTNQLIQIAAIEYMGNVISLLARDD